MSPGRIINQQILSMKKSDSELRQFAKRVRSHVENTELDNLTDGVIRAWLVDLKALLDEASIHRPGGGLF